MEWVGSRAAWIGTVSCFVLIASFVVATVFTVPFVSVLKPVVGLVLIGMVLGWGAYHVVDFNPYEY